MSYVLAVVDEMAVRSGGPLNADGQAWNDAGKTPPVPGPRESGATVACDFKLAPGEIKTVRFVLTWYAPYWNAGALASSVTYLRMVLSQRYFAELPVANQRQPHAIEPINHAKNSPKPVGSGTVVADEAPLPAFVSKFDFQRL